MQSNLALVSLKNIRYNAACISRAAGGTPLFAVVKDDAYGHGAVEVCHALSPLVSAFAVATVEEGVELRIAGVLRDILVLTPPLAEVEVVRGASYGLIFTVSSFATLRLMENASKKHLLSPRVHLAVNTGMNRFGVRPERVSSLLREGAGTRLNFEGVYSHLYAPHDRVAREEQFSRFTQACARARVIFPHLIRHLAATGGILADERYRLDAVRAGIALYGYLPHGFERTIDVKPAMKVYSHVVQSGKFTGGGVGYAVAERDYGDLKTVRFGYGDGLFRAGVPQSVGRLCMDAHLREGSSRLGRRELVIKDVAAYAEEMGTIPYEILCRMGAKAVKRYVR